MKSAWLKQLERAYVVELDLEPLSYWFTMLPSKVSATASLA